MLWWVMTPEYQVVASDIVCVSPFQGQGLVLKNNWIVCSKYDYHPNLNSQDSWRGGGGGLEYNHSMYMRVFTFMLNKILRMNSKNNEVSGNSLDLDMLAILS